MFIDSRRKSSTFQLNFNNPTHIINWHFDSYSYLKVKADILQNLNHTSLYYPFMKILNSLELLLITEPIVLAYCFLWRQCSDFRRFINISSFQQNKPIHKSIIYCYSLWKRLRILPAHLILYKALLTLRPQWQAASKIN